MILYSCIINVKSLVLFLLHSSAFHLVLHCYTFCLALFLSCTTNLYSSLNHSFLGVLKLVFSVCSVSVMHAMLHWLCSGSEHMTVSLIFFWRITSDSCFNFSPNWVTMRSSNQGVCLLRKVNSLSCQEKEGNHDISYW